MPIAQSITNQKTGQVLANIWATEIDEGTLLQIGRTSRIPILAGPVAVMPDAHFGMGATIGSVVVTDGAVMPSCVGVDLGCGMDAVLTNLTDADLPDDMNGLLPQIAKSIPAGVGTGHEQSTKDSSKWFDKHGLPGDGKDAKLNKSALTQFGTLGSGNHFFEVCLDEDDRVWMVVHSGSRGVGNRLAQGHIKIARDGFKKYVEGDYDLEDKDLAWFTQNTPEFDSYIHDMLWSQAYAFGNRQAMMNAGLKQLFNFVGKGNELDRISCHHNFCQQETFDDRTVWVTRKGAIKADIGDRGVIPGSMGAETYVIEGKGNKDSWNSCSHGAGRRMSRTKAKKEFTVEDLTAAMGNRVWNKDHASSLIDEIPGAYKDIGEVMAAQSDLVTITAKLHQILNFKGQ